jgi:TatD DNase family protein
MFIDLHCHLDHHLLNRHVADIVGRAKVAGLKCIVTSGLHPESNRMALELCRTYPIVRASLGLYPIDALQREMGSDYLVNVDEELAFIKEQGEKVLAIGEIGLDYKTGHDREAQKGLFRRQLDLAVELQKPVIIHSRAAEPDVLEILAMYPGLTIILHCFSGKKKLMLQARDRGYFFTIPTHIGRASQFQELAKAVQLNQLFCETDAPFLSPFRHTSNEPAFVVESYRKIAEIKGITLEETSRIVFNNWQRVFL